MGYRKKNVLLAFCLIPFLFTLYVVTVKRVYGEFYKRASGDFSGKDVLKYQGFLLKSLGFYPFNHSARSSLANTYIYTGRRQNALEQMEEALRTGFLPSSGYKARGVVLFKDGGVEEALRSFEKALILSPEDPETLEYIALIYITREQYPEALRCLDRATKEDPMRPNSYYLYGKIHETWKQDQVKAKEYYGKAVQFQDPRTKLIFAPEDLPRM